MPARRELTRDGEPERFMVSALTVFFCDLRCTSDRRTEQRIGQSTSLREENPLLRE